jgi:uncharacterized protein (TIGR03067 family)
MLRPLACTFIALLVASLAMAEDAPLKVIHPLHGKWKITKAEAGGERKGAFPPNAHFRFDADGKTAALIVGDETPQPGTYESNDTKTPHQILIKTNSDQPGRGIYKIEKEILTVCISVKMDDPAPEELAVGKTAGVLLILCERVK